MTPRQICQVLVTDNDIETSRDLVTDDIETLQVSKLSPEAVVARKLRQQLRS